MTSSESARATAPGIELSVRCVLTLEAGLVERLNTLIGQLSSRSAPQTDSSLRQLLDSKGSHLFVAERGCTIVGTLCLVIFSCPTGVRAFIEDVVVDASARRTGAAQALTRAAIELAQRQGVRTIELSCRPHRLAANLMYQKLGFQVRETNFYRLECT